MLLHINVDREKTELFSFGIFVLFRVCCIIACAVGALVVVAPFCSCSFLLCFSFLFRVKRQTLACSDATCFSPLVFLPLKHYLHVKREILCSAFLRSLFYAHTLLLDCSILLWSTYSTLLIFSLPSLITGFSSVVAELSSGAPVDPVSSAPLSPIFFILSHEKFIHAFYPNSNK